MSSASHFKELNRGVNSFNHWRRVNDKEIPDLNEVYLDKMKFPNVNLSYANLERSSCQNCNFAGSNMREANFKGANLANASFFKASMNEIDLSSSNLSNAYLVNSDLFESKLLRANLSRADLQGSQLSYANLFEVNGKEASFEGALLTHSKLYGAILINSNFKGAQLENSDLEAASLINATMKNADLYEANLQRVDFEGADLTGAKLFGSTLKGAINLTQQQLESAYGDRTTQLPDYLSYPETWQYYDIKKEDEESEDNIRAFPDDRTVISNQKGHKVNDQIIQIRSVSLIKLKELEIILENERMSNCSPFDLDGSEITSKILTAEKIEILHACVKAAISLHSIDDYPSHVTGLLLSIRNFLKNEAKTLGESNVLKYGTLIAALQLASSSLSDFVENLLR